MTNCVCGHTPEVHNKVTESNTSTHCSIIGCHCTAFVESDDPWVNRSGNMKCGTCMWFVEKKSIAPGQLGRCRRHAPTMAGFPVVYLTDWCGDHKLDGGKIR